MIIYTQIINYYYLIIMMSSITFREFRCCILTTICNSLRSQYGSSPCSLLYDVYRVGEHSVLFNAWKIQPFGYFIFSKEYIYIYIDIYFYIYSLIKSSRSKESSRSQYFICYSKKFPRLREFKDSQFSLQPSARS